MPVLTKERDGIDRAEDFRAAQVGDEFTRRLYVGRTAIRIFGTQDSTFRVIQIGVPGDPYYLRYKLVRVDPPRLQPPEESEGAIVRDLYEAEKRQAEARVGPIEDGPEYGIPGAMRPW